MSAQKFKAITIREAVDRSRLPSIVRSDALWLLDELLSRDKTLIPVVVSGSASFAFDQNGVMEKAARMVGRMLRELPIALITGGMPGVGQTVGEAYSDAEACSDRDLPKAHLFHILPRRESVQEPPEGWVLRLGDFFPERQMILGVSARINIVIGGGPGATREANTTLANGGFVLPIGCTGGAASGLEFDLSDPIECRIDLETAKRQATSDEFMSEYHWEGMSSPLESYTRAVRIVYTAIQQVCQSQKD